MFSRSVQRNKLLFDISCALLTVIAAFSIITLLISHFSFGNVIEEKWDGVEMSSSFSSGNGTEDNPYLIKNGADLNYFKSLIEGNNYNIYADKYYKLAANIDLNGYKFNSIGISSEEELRIFKGNFDGAGYTISNLNVGASVVEDYSVYGLFSIISDATIENLNISNVEIYPNEVEMNKPCKIGVVAGEVRTSYDEQTIDALSSVNNISIVNSVINLSEINSENSNVVGGILGNVSKYVEFYNIYYNGNLTADFNTGVSKLVNNLESDLTNVISFVSVDSSLEIVDYGNIVDSEVNNQYTVIDDGENYVVKLNNDDVDVNELLVSLNDKLDVTYYWQYNAGIFTIAKNDISIVEETPIMNFAFGKSAPIPLHDSGIDEASETIYINDLVSDRNYYKGLNYTTSSDGKIPTGVNRNLYTDNNLARVYIQYSGTDIEGNNTGYVSLDEQISKFNYYKYYVVENGVLSFELIDHPFADRPNNKAFGGWITDYPGAVIKYDRDIHVYSVEIPVTDISEPISITFYAVWMNANTGTVSATTAAGWTNALANLKDAGFYLYGKRPVYGSVTSYYVNRTVNRNSRYPSGAVNATGGNLTGTCRTWGGCEYYIHATGNYDDTEIYYSLINGSMTEVSVPPSGYEDDPDAEQLPEGTVVAGYYKVVNVPNGRSMIGYYDSSGDYITSGNCNNGSGCNVYERLGYYDSEGNVNYSNTTDVYAYLVTRDSNILVLRANNANRLNTTKPLTLTGINNGTDSGNYYLDLRSTYLGAAADLRVEHIMIRTDTSRSATSDPPSNNTTSDCIYGNLFNLKIGRGIAHYNNYTSSRSVVGSLSNTSSGSNGAAVRYRLIIESGRYNSLSVGNGYNTSGTFYLDGMAIYGSDFDRIDGNNTSMDVYGTAAGNWGGTIHSKDDFAPSLTTVVKSGTFGSSKDDYTSGIYVGGLNYGALYAPRVAIVEGGYIYNILGGPLTDASREDKNDIFINQKGGEIDVIVGGAGRSETYGNRIINVTGGKVNYAVFGGSNGYSGNNSNSYRGTLTSSTFVYVGGNAEVGDTDIINSGNDLYGEEIGSVFAIGNGNADYDMIGTAKTSHLIIADEAIINTNAYGGGNHGAVGIDNDNNTNTKIDILGGTVKGSVYGGGNNNGAGATDVKATVDINMTGGTIYGSLYGGSNANGIIYGDSNVNVFGGTVTTDVYGGGRGGYVNTNNQGTYVSQKVNVNIGRTTAPLDVVIGGSVYGGSAYGTVNGTTRSATTISQYGTTVTVNNGTIRGSVFGGGKGSATYTPYVLGNVIVNINGGNIGRVFGGNDAAGSPNGTDVVYLSGGTIGDCFGGGNATGQKNTDIYLQGSTVTNLYGGSNQSGIVTDTKVTVTSGTVNGNIYGGNNLGTSTTNCSVSVSNVNIIGDIYGGGSQADAETSTVVIGETNINNVYGGGEKASVASTSVTLNNTTGKKVFGGSNIEGDVTNSKVIINGLKLDAVYGGNNAGGTTATTNVTINNGTITDVYGGGDQASSTISNILINNGNVVNVYGGGNKAGLNTSNVDVVGGTVVNVFGGSNTSGDLTSSNVEIGSEHPAIDVDLVYNAIDVEPWQTQDYITYVPIEVKLTNRSSVDISDWQIKLIFSDDTVLANNYSNSDISIENDEVIITSTNRYYGFNTLGANGGSYTIVKDNFMVYSNTSKEDFKIKSIVLVPSDSSEIKDVNVTNVYGGNNEGGLTSSTNVLVNYGNISDVYGGGNLAPVDKTNVIVTNAVVTNIYGGGNKAAVNENTYLDIDDSTMNTNVYGGGNEGEVKGNTDVYITNVIARGSLYAGGNGSTATVYGNTNISIDGSTIVGNENSKSPHAGCVFGGGNAAVTGSSQTSNSTAKVNIVGAHIYGNVYGGANTSVIYGATVTNIGNAVVSNDNLIEDNIIIGGTVFGGGESNAAGEEDYDFEFKSVIGSIDVNINGKGYLNNGHSFILSGSIFGSGNASSSEGTSTITVTELGTKDNPSENISFQRTNLLTIDHSYIQLEGIEDRTNEYSDILYSFNQIDSLIIKNNTTLLLKRNANMLKEFYSGVEVDGELVPAKVEIDDETKTVTKNVDNRIYMIPNRNLNITTNESATAYGKVTGMTFFGMYNSYASGAFSYGLYDSNVDYGDEADAGDAIMGGSYVLGLHSLNHDITVDGFYTNVLTDDFTEIVTEYIEPTPNDTNYYRWIVGMQAINYTVQLTASKYSSLGTYNLSMLDFSAGDTIFNVIGFNSEGLGAEIQLVDSNEVPRVTNTAEEANQILGLSMKSETREWTSYGTTKFIDDSGGKYTGDTSYKTDSQKVAPSLMFYLYHAKNITLDGDLGTVVITLQALTPRNEIEYDVHFITITVEITARNYDDGDSYDASITYDKKYEMPSVTDVNITNQSQFTAYYSLFAASDTLDNFYGNGNSNYHVLTTNYPLPVGSQITMIDYGYDHGNPQYYYFNVTEDVYNDSLNQLSNYNEIVYRLSDFIKMGSISTDNRYNDQNSNNKYYSAQYKRTIEEFIFIFDLKETTTTGTHLDNSILFELRNSEDRTMVSVLGIRQNLMKYNLFDSSNVVLEQELVNSNDYIYYDVSNLISFGSNVAYDQTDNRQVIIDTNYESSSMGLNVFIFDSSGNQVSSSLLTGTILKIDNQSYFAASDGVFRIKLAGKVSNLKRNIYLLAHKTLPPGVYKLRFVLFASDDGMHNSSLANSSVKELNVTVVGDDNAIIVNTLDETKVVDGDLVLNQNGTNVNEYEVKYNSVLLNPNVRLSVFKRDITSDNAITYTEVSFNSLFKNSLDSIELSNFKSQYLYERILLYKGTTNRVFKFTFQDNLVSGTYKLVFRLYDNDQEIEEEIKYVIVTKKIENT